MDTISRLTEIAEYFRDSIKSNPNIDKGQIMKDVIAIEAGINAIDKMNSIKEIIEDPDITVDQIRQIIKAV